MRNSTVGGSSGLSLPDSITKRVRPCDPLRGGVVTQKLRGEQAVQRHYAWSWIMCPKHEKIQALLKRLGEGDRATENGRLDRHRDALRRMVAVRLDPAITGPMDTSNDYAANPRPV